ncbi:MAG: hypothetical protein ACOZF0_00615 [Thermodesulfobacteriota bacterium]
MFRKSLCMGLILLLSIPAVVFSAPSITSVTGTIAKDEILTITGAAFGTKATPKPFKWDNFEKGTLGAKVGAPSSLSANTTNWILKSSGVAGREPVYNGTQLRKNSARSSYHNMSVPDENCYGSGLGIDFASEDFIYLTWWGYYEETGNPTDNWKYFRHYGPPVHGITKLTSPVYYMEGIVTDYVNKSIPNKQWVRIECAYKAGLDGAAKFWLHTTSPESIILNSDISGDYSGSFKELRIMDYYRRMAAGSTVVDRGLNAWLDDVYVDTTQARVEAGNMETWSGCTHREIQIPSKWESNSISITFNQGSFDNGKTVFVYVVDANGSVNTQGYPVTIGGTAAATAPPATTLSISTN